MKKHCLSILIVFVSLSIYGQTIPESPRIRSIHLHTGQVEIEWEKSTNDSVDSYEVQYGTDEGSGFLSWPLVVGTEVDSSITSQSFSPTPLDDASPMKRSTPFAVKAFIGIVNSTTDKKDWDSTIYLTASFDNCLATLFLNWTPYDYNMWEYGTKEYQVYLKKNDESYLLYESLSPDNLSFEINDLIGNNVYKVYIAAVADNDSVDVTTSNAVEIDIDMESLPEYIHADYATYVSGNTEVSFSIDSLSELDEYNLLRTADISGVYDTIANFTDIRTAVSYVDNVDYATGPYYYMLNAINYCGESIRSSDNTASSIVLHIQGDPSEPELVWNEYSYWINGVDDYQIQRKIGDEAYEEIARVTTEGFTDNSLASQIGNGASARVCYKISAYESDNPYGLDATSNSNEACVLLPVNMRFEYDAFTPGSSSGNDRYGPQMDFFPEEFEFTVLDRAGLAVFKTNNAQDPYWDGTFNGNYVTQGAYLYVVKYTEGEGKPKRIRGGFVVAYP